jgi:peptide/nickel transport system substrate-binding protein
LRALSLRQCASEPQRRIACSRAGLSSIRRSPAPPACWSPGAASRAQSANPAAKRGGTLAAAIFADPLSFDPHITGNLQGRAACRAIHDTLLTVDAKGLLAPGLVETWERPDDKTFVLKLRAGLKFHDGSALDAAAVKYNIDRIRNPGTNSIRGGEITALDTVTVVDARTVRLALKYPFAAFLYPFTDVSGCIGSPTAFEKWGQDYTLHPAGAGPFTLGEYQKDARTVLERNPNYWAAGKPYLDRVVLRPIPTDSTRLAELRSGGVQLAEALPLQDIARLRQGQELVVSEKVGFRWEYFGFNLRDQYPGKSKKFRQAFQYASTARRCTAPRTSAPALSASTASCRDRRSSTRAIGRTRTTWTWRRS